MYTKEKSEITTISHYSFLTPLLFLCLCLSLSIPFSLPFYSLLSKFPFLFLSLSLSIPFSLLTYHRLRIDQEITLLFHFSAHRTYDTMELLVGITRFRAEFWFLCDFFRAVFMDQWKTFVVHTKFNDGKVVFHAGKKYFRTEFRFSLVEVVVEIIYAFANGGVILFSLQSAAFTVVTVFG